MPKDITVHFVGNARDLATSAALAGESVERFGHKVAVAGAQSAAASAGFDLSSLKLVDMGRKGVTPTNILIGLGVALGALLLPLAAYTAGLTAALTVGATVVGSMGLLGAGVIALAAHYGGWTHASKELTKAQEELQKAEEAVHNARKPTVAQLERLKDAQDAYTAALAKADNPLTKLMGNLDAMGKRLAELATPIASTLLQWLSDLIEPVEKLGGSLLRWFGERLPLVLPVATRLFKDVLDALESLGKKMAPIFDDLLAHPETFEKAFKEALRIVVDATAGLLGKFDELMKWWGDNGPELEKNARETMKKISDAFTTSAAAVGGLVQAMDSLERKFGEWEKPWQDTFRKLDEAQRHLDDVSGSTRILTNALGAFVDFLLFKLPNPVNEATWFMNTLAGAIERVTRAFGDYQRAIGHGGGGGGGGGGGLFAQHGGIFPPGSMVNVGEVAQEMAYALPGGGIMVLPTGPGRGGGSGVVNYNLTFNVPPHVNQAEIGSTIVSAIQEYERRGGRAWRGA